MRPSIIASRRTPLLAWTLTPALLLFAPAAVPAGEQLPDPRNSSFPGVIIGRPPASPANQGGPLEPINFPVILKDVANAPIVGQEVVLRFPDPAIRLYAVQAAGTTVDCAARTLSRITDANGLASFSPRFGGHSGPTVEIWRGSTEELGRARARSFDIDGIDGKVGLNDFALLTQNLLYDTSAAETDFDLNGSTGVGDFARFAEHLLLGAQGSSCP